MDTHHDDQHDLRVDPREVNGQDGEPGLEKDAPAELEPSHHLFDPVLRPGLRDVQLDLSARNSSLDTVAIPVKELAHRPPIRRPPCLRRNDVQEQHERSEDDDDVEPPFRIEVRDDTRASQETQRQRRNKAPRPNPQPDPHPATVSPYIINNNKLLVRIRALQRRAKKIEQRGERVDVSEAEGQPREEAGQEQAGGVARVGGRAWLADYGGLWELEGQSNGEGGEGVGFAAVEEGERPEDEG